MMTPIAILRTKMLKASKNRIRNDQSGEKVPCQGSSLYPTSTLPLPRTWTILQRQTLSSQKKRDPKVPNPKRVTSSHWLYSSLLSTRRRRSMWSILPKLRLRNRSIARICPQTTAAITIPRSKHRCQPHPRVQGQKQMPRHPLVPHLTWIRPRGHP